MNTPPPHQPGQLAREAPRAPRHSPIGRWVVIALLLLGAAMGCVTVWYWTTQVKLADTEQATSSDTHGNQSP